MSTSNDWARDGLRVLRGPSLLVSGALILGFLSNVLPSAVRPIGLVYWWYEVPITLARSMPPLIAADLLFTLFVLETGGAGVRRLARAHLAVGVGLVALAVGHAVVLPGLAAKLPYPTFETFFWGGSGRCVLVLASAGVLAAITGRRMLAAAGRRLATAPTD